MIQTAKILKDAARAAEYMLIEDELLNGLNPNNEGYYKLLYWAARFLQPPVMVELGVYKGVSAAYMKSGCPHGTMIGVDIIPPPLLISQFGVNFHMMDSIEFLSNCGTMDMVHIDTIHEVDHVDQEFWLAIRKMNSPGVIFIDDIRIDRKMSAWWDAMPEAISYLPAIRLEFPTMHSTGYGAVVL